MAKEELSDQDLTRQDYVDNAIFGLLTDLLPPGGPELEWDSDLIGELRDAIEEAFVERKLCSDQAFYPYLED